jgi:transcriptional regulator GlxA family with amidase domain
MRKVQKAKEIMDDKFAEIESLEEVALQVDLSHDRLRHFFKEETGTSLIGYLTGVRIAHAKVLLENSPMPLERFHNSYIVRGMRKEPMAV